MALQWKDIPMGNSSTTILWNVSTGRPHSWIPASLRRHVFGLIHDLSHPTRRATARLMSQKFVWHSISRDAGNWVQSCTPRQKSKAYRHTETGSGPFHQPQTFRSHPCGRSEPPSSVSWTPFDILKHITSDRGNTFTSQLWTSLGHLLGSSVNHTTAYNPEANDMVERFHRTLKAALISRCNNATWSTQLPWVLLGLCTTPKEGLDVSPAEMVFGESLVVPSEFFPDAPTNNINRLRSIVKEFAPYKQTYKSPEHRYVPRDLHTSNMSFSTLRLRHHPSPHPSPAPSKLSRERRKLSCYALKTATIGSPSTASSQRTYKTTTHLRYDYPGRAVPSRTQQNILAEGGIL
ncbi:uncharacterized protein LOC143041292 [Oratosquilla oratoria]|uniref:uncharacterized protein LOC143041292 n=1 Tax=Oratosquilla oratoria TaxID=337810 RepID=UPI003F75A8CE